MIHRRRRRLCFEDCESRHLLAVLTVNSLDDGLDAIVGRTTLREAVALANAVPNSESATILFDVGLSGGTIQLSAGELAIERSMSIDASELTLGITLDASGNDPTPSQQNGDGTRIFVIDDHDATNRADVYLRNLALTGGDAQKSGGAILTAEKLTVSSSRIFDNASQSRGGGIAATCGNMCASTLVIQGSELAENSADEGGAIYVTGSVEVSDSVLTSNTSARGGGAIYSVRNHANNANIIVRDSEISENTSGGAGGVFAYGQEGAASISIQRSRIVDNSGEVAGGVFALAHFSSIRVAESTVQGNSAVGGGGGVFANSDDGKSIITILASTIADNAGGSGGGVFAMANSGADLSIEQSTISGNSALRGGGGVAVAGGGGQMKVEYSTIVRNSAGVAGGGLWTLHQPIVLLGSIVAQIKRLREPTFYRAGSRRMSITVSSATIRTPA